VDTPAETLTEADRLVTTVMAERGYPTEDYDQRLAPAQPLPAATSRDSGQPGCCYGSCRSVTRSGSSSSVRH
jgi:hypothetical protein